MAGCCASNRAPTKLPWRLSIFIWANKKNIALKIGSALRNYKVTENSWQKSTTSGNCALMNAWKNLLSGLTFWHFPMESFARRSGKWQKQFTKPQQAAAYSWHKHPREPVKHLQVCSQR